METSLSNVEEIINLITNTVIKGSSRRAYFGGQGIHSTRYWKWKQFPTEFELSTYE